MAVQVHFQKGFTFEFFIAVWTFKRGRTMILDNVILSATLGTKHLVAEKTFDDLLPKMCDHVHFHGHLRSEHLCAIVVIAADGQLPDMPCGVLGKLVHRVKPNATLDTLRGTVLQPAMSVQVGFINKLLITVWTLDSGHFPVLFQLVFVKEVGHFERFLTKLTR